MQIIDDIKVINIYNKEFVVIKDAVAKCTKCSRGSDMAVEVTTTISKAKDRLLEEIYFDLHKGKLLKSFIDKYQLCAFGN